MFIKESWFWRGFQSAIFYYISCAPCTKIVYRRKKRKESRRAQAEKKALAMTESHLAGANQKDPYPEHPLPTGTNPFWSEEITLGPGPPPKRHNKERERERYRLLELQGRESGVASSSGSKATSNSTTEDHTEPASKQSEESEDGWNRRRYQRADDLLWGLDYDGADHHPTMGPVALSRSGSSSQAGKYYYARNPAVNDLHPPVVSTAPQSKTETRWMLQPPPRAKVMEGKERENRSRSGSGGSEGSSMRPGGAASISKALGERMAGGTSRAGEPSPVFLRPANGSRSRGSSNLSATGSVPLSRTATGGSVSGQRHDRDTITSHPHESVPGSREYTPSQHSTRNDRPPRISIEGETPVSSAPQPRPPLSPILSTSLVPTDQENKCVASDNSPEHAPPPASTDDPSREDVLQELNPAGSNNQRSLNPSMSILEATAIKLPPANMTEDEQLRGTNVDGVTGRNEHGQFSPVDRENHTSIRPQRWSMDI